ncbi:TetR/AcrR family transcriptional regulator C-terminal domain-containing protein [Streptosporangium sp. NPDC049046]|uniref:TetR/AcrR family transcriptional regulator n=1 Tax=unclassified Streptosporangium TaxID=2632669 RepID=UPI003438FC66
MIARGGTRGREAGRALTRQQIVDAAVRIGDIESLDTLTIRRLATELGVGTMTLYSYFRSKDEILDAMADDVLGRIRLPQVDPGDPEALLVACGMAFRDMMRTHPCVVRLLSTRVNTSHASLAGSMEGVLALLRAAGLSDRLTVQAYGLLITYALGFSSYQAPRVWGHSGGEDAEELRRRRRHFYAGLPADRFPTVVDLSEELTTLPSDDQFARGLRLLAHSLVAEMSTASP